MKGIEQMIGTVLIVAAVVVVGVLLFLFAINMFKQTSSRAGETAGNVTNVAILDISSVKVKDCNDSTTDLNLEISLTNTGSTTTPDLTGLLKIMVNGVTVYTKQLKTELDGIAPGDIKDIYVDINGSDFNSVKTAAFGQNAANLCGRPFNITIEITGRGIQTATESFTINPIKK